MACVPRVSIGLPVRNGEKCLVAALDSLLGQTFADFELLISDNASTDGTQDICRQFAARDRRIRYSRCESNMGVAWNFNRAFSLAQGEYFKWAAYDDVCAPTYIQRCVEVLDRQPDVAWCFTRFSHIDPWGNLLDDPAACDISYLSADGLDRAAPHAHQRFRSVLLGGGSCLDNYSVVRREVMARTILQLPYYGADKVFITDLCLYGRYAEVPETLFYVRVHPDGSGNLPSAEAQQAFYDPRSSHRAALTRFRLLAAYLRIIRRAPTLGALDRLRCYHAVFCYLAQVRKWRRVVESLVRGLGTGGAYLDPLRRLKRPPKSPPSSFNVPEETQTTEAAAHRQ